MNLNHNGLLRLFNVGKVIDKFESLFNSVKWYNKSSLILLNHCVVKPLEGANMIHRKITINCPVVDVIKLFLEEI